jgi:hypothetical protein
MQLGMVFIVLLGEIHWVVRLPASNAAMGRLMAGIGALVTFCVMVAVMIFSPFKVGRLLVNYGFERGCNALKGSSKL